MISLTSLPRHRRFLPHRPLLLGLSALLLLAGCESATVPTAIPPVQDTPPPSAAAAPAVILGGPLRAETAEPPAGAAVTQTDLDSRIRVGLLLPLSGPQARLGQALLNAAQMALFDVGGDGFALVVGDTGSSPEGAVAATQQVLSKGAKLILGPLFATSVEAMAASARAAQVNVVAYSNDRAVAGDGVYVVGLGPRPQMDRMITYAVSQSLTRLAVFAPDTPYGAAVVDSARDAAARTGAVLTRVVLYKSDAPDLTPEVRLLADYEARHQALLAQRQLLAASTDEAAMLALKRLDGLETMGPPDFHAVILPDGSKRVQSIAPLLAYFDVDPAEIRFLGTALWDDPELGAEPSLQNAWFTAPTPALWTSFRDRYQKTFGEAPPRLATLAYDTTALSAVLARRAQEKGQEPDFSQVALTQASGFSGIDGVFRFLPTGEVERTLAILEIRRNGFKVIDEAPRSFQPLVN
ncbi:MAG TPA: penicillin-binding protein activator [Kiloniellales bacterium]